MAGRNKSTEKLLKSTPYRVFSIWTHLPEKGVTTMVEGTSIPVFANGGPQHKHNKLIKTIKAKSMNQAYKKFKEFIESK